MEWDAIGGSIVLNDNLLLSLSIQSWVAGRLCFNCMELGWIDGLLEVDEQLILKGIIYMPFNSIMSCRKALFQLHGMRLNWWTSWSGWTINFEGHYIYAFQFNGESKETKALKNMNMGYIDFYIAFHTKISLERNEKLLFQPKFPWKDV